VTDKDKQSQDEDDLDSLDDGTEAIFPDDNDDEKKVEASGEGGETPAEEGGETPAEEGEGEEKKSSPRSRFNEKNEEAKRLTAENEALRQQIGQQPAAPAATSPANGKDDEDALFSELAAASRARKKAIEDDDDDGTVKADRDIAELNHKIIAARMGGNAPLVDQDEVTAAAVDQIEWKAGLKQVYKDYPVLNANDADKADSALIQEVLDMQEAIMSRGEGKANSLEKAVHYVMGAAGIKSVGTTKPSLDPKSKSTAKQAAKKAPAIGKVGELGEEKPVSLADLSDEEISALPESKLKQLQGDFL